MTLREAWKFRRSERWLLLLTWLVIAAGFLLVLASRQKAEIAAKPDGLLPLGVFGLGLMVLHVWFVLIRFRGDQTLVVAALFLAGFGLLMRFRLAGGELENWPAPAALAFPAGLLLLPGLATIFRNGRHAFLRFLYPLAWLAACAVLAYILYAGRRYRGAVYLPGHLNPAELIKLLLAIFLAGYLSVQRENNRLSLRDLLKLAFLWLIPMILLVFQRDLGMALLLNALLVILLYVASGRWLLLTGCLLPAGAAFFTFASEFAHSQQRIAVWLNPFRDPTGAAWQILQGLSAMYTGGLWGAGLGAGAPGYIPIAESDFVWAALAEEIGFAGCTLILAFYLVLFQRGLRVAAQARSSFSSLLALGLIAGLMIQTLVNIGGVVKALPMTGIPLPLISHGGSSLLTTFLALGLLLAISEPDAASVRREKK